MRLVAICFMVIAIAGCSQPTQSKTASGTTSHSGVQQPLTLIGPRGRVSIGDSLEAAKRAFPAPKDAQIFETSLSFSIITPDGWAWSVENKGEGFEAAVKAGKVVGLALTKLGQMPAKNREEECIAQLGKPSGRADGKTASMLVWKSGPNARYQMLLRSKETVFGPGEMTLIGNAEDLKLLGYHADEPAILVKQMDASAEAMKGINLKDEFARAKDRAKAKAKSK